MRKQELIDKRKEYGLSIEDICLLTGVNQATVEDFESGAWFEIGFSDKYGQALREYELAVIKEKMMTKKKAETDLLLDPHDGQWYQVKETGLVMLREPASFEEWAEPGPGWAVARRSIPFIIGDWVNIGDDKFGERWSQVTDVFGDYDYATIQNYASCCRKVPIDVRDPDLSFSHHQAVAPLERGEQIHWLKIAKFDPEEKRMLTAAELRAKLKEEDTTLTPEQELEKLAKKLRNLLRDMNAIADENGYTDYQKLMINISALTEDLLDVIRENLEELEEV